MHLQEGSHRALRTPSTARTPFTEKNPAQIWKLADAMPRRPLEHTATNCKFPNTSLIHDLGEFKVRYRIASMVCELSCTMPAKKEMRATRKQLNGAMCLTTSCTSANVSPLWTELGSGSTISLKTDDMLEATWHSPWCSTLARPQQDVSHDTTPGMLQLPFYHTCV